MGCSGRSLAAATELTLTAVSAARKQIARAAMHVIVVIVFAAVLPRSENR